MLIRPHNAPQFGKVLGQDLSYNRINDYTLPYDSSS